MYSARYAVFDGKHASEFAQNKETQRRKKRQDMSKQSGPLWDVIEGRVPAPPSAQLLGWKLLEIDPEHGTATVEFQARPEFVNAVGTIQGGFLAAMLDDTLGPALAATLDTDEFAPTIELKVNFLRPAQVGRLIAHGRVIHKGKSLAFLQGELRTADGQLIAAAGK